MSYDPFLRFWLIVKRINWTYINLLKHVAVSYRFKMTVNFYFSSFQTYHANCSPCLVNSSIFLNLILLPTMTFSFPRWEDQGLNSPFDGRVDSVWPTLLGGFRPELWWHNESDAGISKIHRFTFYDQPIPFLCVPKWP